MRKSRALRDIDHAATKEELLRSGVAALTEKGFASVGLDEILRKVGVPKGSFYYYFDSKNDFVTRVLQRYDERFLKGLDFYLNDKKLSARDGLIAFMENAKRNVIKHDYKRGCLVGNLSEELNTLPEDLSKKVAEVLLGWQQKLQCCLEKAQASGDISKDADCKLLASAFWSGWEGGVLRARLERSTVPLDVFGKFFIDSVFSKYR
jgi:TetR/AcrR family transcriptional repressor of nem operon